MSGHFEFVHPSVLALGNRQKLVAVDSMLWYSRSDRIASFTKKKYQISRFLSTFPTFLDRHLLGSLWAIHLKGRWVFCQVFGWSHPLFNVPCRFLNYCCIDKCLVCVFSPSLQLWNSYICSFTWKWVRMSLQWEWVKHLNHLCELDPPEISMSWTTIIGIISLIISKNINRSLISLTIITSTSIQTVAHPTSTKMLWTLIPDKSVYLLVPDVVAEDEQSVLDVASSAQRFD